MRVAVTVFLAVAVACVACASAFPSKFLTIAAYSSNVYCNSTASTVVYEGIDQCVVNSGSGPRSIKYTEAATGVVYRTDYTANSDCTGASTTLARNFTNLACYVSGTSSERYVYPSSIDLYSSTSWSGSSCDGTPQTGPQFNPFGQCIGGGSRYAKYERAGSKLSICQYSDSACSGSGTCAEVPKGECFNGVMFDFNAASAAAPQFVVAAVAILAAVASLRM